VRSRPQKHAELDLSWSCHVGATVPRIKHRQNLGDTF
jgi:hypothetical protein